MKIIDNDGSLKTVYKIVGAVVAAFWGLFALTAAYRYVSVKAYPLKYKEFAIKYAIDYDLEPELVFAVIKTESDFNEKAESGKHAKGLMQITEETGAYVAAKLGKKTYDLLDAETNIAFGCYYLRYLFDGFYSERETLAAYNAGEGNVRKWLQNPEYSDDGKTLKSVPFKETEAYIKKIYKNFGKYKKIYGKLLDKTKKNG